MRYAGIDIASATHVIAIITAEGAPPAERLDAELIAAEAQLLSKQPRDADARLQAVAARAYGLQSSQFDHILSTFPLVEPSVRAAVRSAFYDIVS